MRIKSILAVLFLLITGLIVGCTAAQLESTSNGFKTAQNATTNPIVQDAVAGIPQAQLVLGGVGVLFGITSAVFGVLAKKKSDQAATMQGVAQNMASKLIVAHSGIQEVFSDALNWKNPTVPWSKAVGDLLADLNLEPAAPTS